MHAEFMDGQVASWPVPHCCRQVLHAQSSCAMLCWLLTPLFPQDPWAELRHMSSTLNLVKAALKGFSLSTIPI